jgi:hypothetical protein
VPVTERDAVDATGPVLAAVRRDLARMPADLRESTTAAAAQALATSIDLGTETYRFQASLVSQLVACMNELAAKAPAESEGDAVDDLNARRAARRSANAAG